MPKGRGVLWTVAAALAFVLQLAGWLTVGITLFTGIAALFGMTGPGALGIGIGLLAGALLVIVGRWAARRLGDQSSIWDSLRP